MPNYIDSRDLIKEQEDLKEEIREWYEQDPEERAYDQDEIEEMQERVDEIEALGEGIEDWIYGATMIPEHDFEDYAREFAEDIGAISADTSWPATCIDWERAARELAMDYTSVEWEGTTYYVR